MAWHTIGLQQPYIATQFQNSAMAGTLVAPTRTPAVLTKETATIQAIAKMALPVVQTTAQFTLLGNMEMTAATVYRPLSISDNSRSYLQVDLLFLWR